MQHRHITFIGAGNMAKSMIAGLVHNVYPAQFITVCAPSITHRDALAHCYGVHSSNDNISSIRKADVVVLAVKPQIIAKICKSFRKEIDFSRKLVLSIVAGITVNRLYQLFGEKIAIVRIMPNTPCFVRQGMSGLYAPPQTSDEDKKFIAYLIGSIGKIYWLEQENDINRIIAVSGSAPAYFFLFMEAMQQQAQVLGFDERTARTLVLQVAIGSAMLAGDSIDIPFSILGKNVISKEGTTAAAMNVFKKHDLKNIVASAMQAALTRAEEIENFFSEVT